MDAAPVDHGTVDAAVSPSNTRRMNALLLCLVLPFAGKAKPNEKPVAVVLGESIAGVKLDMTLAKVRDLGFDLEPEGVDRANGAGWKSGPLLVIVDGNERVTVVSLTLNESSGVQIGKNVISRRAKLDRIAKILPQCVLGKGSGGRSLECKTDKGTLHFYDSFMNKDVWVMLP